MAISVETASIIRRKASSEWPNDFEMQRHVVQRQTQAAEEMVLYQTKLDMQNPVIEACINKALDEWPDDFEMQVHVFRAQMEAAPKFFNFDHPTIPSETLQMIRTKAFSEWEGDFEMILYTLEQQVAAWEELHR